MKAMATKHLIRSLSVRQFDTLSSIASLLYLRLALRRKSVRKGVSLIPMFGLARKASFSLIGALALSHGLAAEAPSLPAYGADLSQTSVSGLSSGAFMTAQLHVAYSSLFVGAGVIAGGPYYCSGSYEGSSYLQNATGACMNPLTAFVGPNTDKLIQKAQEFARKGSVDDLANLKDDKVYIFTGASDTTVKPLVVKQTFEFYKKIGVPTESIKYIDTVNAGHAIITDKQGDVSCALTDPPYINNCGFIQSHELLRHIHGELNPPANSLSGEIVSFAQSEFIEGFESDSDRSSMSEAGYAYVPKSCSTERCRVHVAFHGCEQGASVIGNEYYTTTGYNEIADTNELIVLYPQAEPSDAIPYNPKGCWDFWGYSSPDRESPNFYTHDAPQMRAVVGMLKRLAQARRP